MKKIVLIAFFVAVGSLTQGCKSDKAEYVKEAYYCPMECEGEKTYLDKDKKCPVCKMALVKKKNTEK